MLGTFGPEGREIFIGLRTDFVDRTVSRRLIGPDGKPLDSTKLETIHPIEIFQGSGDPREGFLFVRNTLDPNALPGRYYSSIGYIDNKPLSYFAKNLAGRRLIGYSDGLVPLPNGANRLANQIGEISGIDVINLFSKEGVGENKRIVLNKFIYDRLAQSQEKRALVLIEDTVTGGNSAKEAVRLMNPLIRAGKVELLGVAAIFDREEGAGATFSELELDFVADFTKTFLFDTLREFRNPNILTPQQYAFVMGD